VPAGAARLLARAGARLGGKLQWLGAGANGTAASSSAAGEL
jgi:hypothetical protein